MITQTEETDADSGDVTTVFVTTWEDYLAYDSSNRGEADFASDAEPIPYYLDGNCDSFMVDVANITDMKYF